MQLLISQLDPAVLTTVCSHPGIVQILEKTEKILAEEIFMVFGGFHLLRHSDAEPAAIIERFKRLGVE
jgi:7,8-dihydropterin-6-yl-methyl-4-(beta-D-ribofuranosyl)aminobenzene 5'-phosphate synthase